MRSLLPVSLFAPLHPIAGAGWVTRSRGLRVSCWRAAGLALVLCVGSTAAASGARIYVLGSGHSGINAAVAGLIAAGHDVTQAGPLADYAGYDQLWDLRYPTALSTDDRSAMDAFLQAGGSILLSGDNSTFDVRNQSINAYLSASGLGAVALVANATGASTQEFTAAGAALNAPNGLANLNLFFA
ncbi:MAG: hypothetical protein MJE66_14225, partial [Proteobacteria bacterium]|nr:hypothetical protein [Pseudomonadota bacterium]